MHTIASSIWRQRLGAFGNPHGVLHYKVGLPFAGRVLDPSCYVLPVILSFAREHTGSSFLRGQRALINKNSQHASVGACVRCYRHLSRTR